MIEIIILMYIGVRFVLMVAFIGIPITMNYGPEMVVFLFYADEEYWLGLLDRTLDTDALVMEVNEMK
jgi:hypothetical protein